MPTRRDFLTASAILPAAVARAAARNRLTLRVAVVGAGAFGGWTALHLRRAGVEVALIDAWGPGNARASSGGETRVIRTIYGPTPRYVQMAARALTLWREWDSGRSEQFYRPTGVLWMIGADDSYVRQSLPALRDLALPCEEIEPTAAGRRWPQVSFEGITKVYLEQEGGYLLARQACEAVAGELVRIGGTYRQVAVVSVSAEGRRPRVRLSDGTTLEADRYVFACGPWLGQLFPDVIGARVQPTRQEVFYFGTPAGDDRFLEARLPVWVEAGDKFVYGIPGNLHRGFKVADDAHGAAFDPDGWRAHAVRRGRALRARLRPSPLPVAGPRARARRGGVPGTENSPDGHFIIDRHPAMSDVWIAGGGSGHGFKMGPALGELLAQQVREDAIPDPFFTLQRLAR